MPDRRRPLRPLCRVAALLFATACAGEPQPPPAPATDSVPADSARPDTVPAAAVPPVAPAPTDPVVARIAARVPAGVFVRSGACPFECCTYREWTAETPIPVYAAERQTGQPAFTIPAGQRFRAERGNVHITSVMVVAVEDSVGDPPYWSFARGDTLVVLDYVGEGRYNVWQAGRVLEAEGFWGVGAPVGNATTYGRWEAEWWVLAVLPDGRSGWFHASRDVDFAGADACA